MYMYTCDFTVSGSEVHLCDRVCTQCGPSTCPNLDVSDNRLQPTKDVFRWLHGMIL